MARKAKKLQELQTMFDENDIDFDDKNTTMRNNSAKNLQIVKKIALSILRTVQIFYKVSLKMIRYRLSLDFDNEISTIFKLLNAEDLKIALYK